MRARYAPRPSPSPRAPSASSSPGGNRLHPIRPCLTIRRTANAAFQVYRVRRRILFKASHVRAAVIVFCFSSAAARAADVCPAPPKVTYTRPADIAPDDHRIHIDTNDAVLGADGHAVLNRRVTATPD